MSGVTVTTAESTDLISVTDIKRQLRIATSDSTHDTILAVMRDSAINIATQLNIPEAIIGISLVAFGTSLPELVVGILSAIRRKVDFALGNVLGSNIYNVLGVLGVSSFFGNFNVPTVIGSADLIFMLFVTVMILGFMFFLKRIGRTYGSVVLILYVGYIFYIYN